ncbi:MAG: MFS transporter [Actinomycetota bacterium]
MHSYEALDRSGGFARRGLLEPFRGRDFRLLWSGMAVSLTGDGIFLVALAWQAYALSNVPTAFSLVGLALSVPHIALLLVGGVIADRFPRRRVMLASDVVRGIAVAAMAVLALTGRLELFHLAALAAVYGAGMAFFGPAFDAIVVDVVAEDLYPQANSLDQLVKPLALRMIGPAVGGWIIGAWGPGAAFFVDAGTFAVSAACLCAMSVGGRGAAGVGLGSLKSELVAGFAFVRSRVWLWGTFGAAALAYLLFMGPAEALVPFVVKNELGGDASDLGLVYALGGAGSICAALAFGRWGVPKRPINLHVPRLDPGHPRGCRLRGCRHDVAAGGRQRLLPRPGDGGHYRLDDPQAKAHSRGASGAGVQSGLAHLDRPVAVVLCPLRAGGRRDRRRHHSGGGGADGGRDHVCGVVPPRHAAARAGTRRPELPRAGDDPSGR